jgi:serine/threonine-protein kinase RsbW
MDNVDPSNEATFKVCRIRSCLEDTDIAKEAIVREIEACSFRESDIFAIKLAMEEALTNAVKHGNRCDPCKSVTVRYAVSPEMCVVIVRDEGGGFRPENVPDPTTPERLPVPNGRGIMLLRAYMDKVEYRDEGREVYFMKRREG